MQKQMLLGLAIRTHSISLRPTCIITIVTKTKNMKKILTILLSIGLALGTLNVFADDNGSGTGGGTGSGTGSGNGPKPITPPSDTAPNQKADIDIKYISISMPVKHRIPVRRATYSEGAIEVEFNTDGGIVNITVTHSSGQLIYMGESNTDTEGNLIIDIPFESGSYSIEFENDSYIGTATLYPNK